MVRTQNKSKPVRGTDLLEQAEFEKNEVVTSGRTESCGVGTQGGERGDDLQPHAKSLFVDVQIDSSHVPQAQAVLRLSPQNLCNAA